MEPYPVPADQAYENNIERDDYDKMPDKMMHITGGPASLYDKFTKIRDFYKQSEQGRASIVRGGQLERISKKVFDSMETVDMTGNRQKSEYLPLALLPMEQIVLVDTTHQLASFYNLLKELDKNANLFQISYSSEEENSDENTENQIEEDQHDPLRMIGLDLEWPEAVDEKPVLRKNISIIEPILVKFS